MKIGGLEFPYDHHRDVSAHGRISGFILRTHPVAMWIPAIIVGLIIGSLLR